MQNSPHVYAIEFLQIYFNCEGIDFILLLCMLSEKFSKVFSFHSPCSQERCEVSLFRLLQETSMPPCVTTLSVQTLTNGLLDAKNTNIAA
jgi:hypothetical protein